MVPKVLIREFILLLLVLRKHVPNKLILVVFMLWVLGSDILIFRLLILEVFVSEVLLLEILH